MKIVTLGPTARITIWRYEFWIGIPLFNATVFEIIKYYTRRNDYFGKCLQLTLFTFISIRTETLEFSFILKDWFFSNIFFVGCKIRIIWHHRLVCRRIFVVCLFYVFQYHIRINGYGLLKIFFILHFNLEVCLKFWLRALLI